MWGDRLMWEDKPCGAGAPARQPVPEPKRPRERSEDCIVERARLQPSPKQYQRNCHPDRSRSDSDAGVEGLGVFEGWRNP